MRSLAVRCAAICVLALLAVTSCGLSIDDSPRSIAIENLDPELRPGQLPTPQTASESGPGREQIHMIQRGNRLIPVERQIVDTPEQLLEILFLGTFPQEAAEGIESAIFRGTEVQNVEVNELFNLAIVDLAPGSLNPGANSEQRLAFAQIVYTLTSLDGIDAVKFVQSDPDDPDAEPIDLVVQTDEGATTPGARVNRDDFSLLSPDNAALPSFDIPIATPSPTPDPNAPPTFELVVWMLDSNDRLTKVDRTIEPTPDGYLVALLEGVLPEERDRGIRSAIPPDALANPVEVGRFDIEVIDQFGNSMQRSVTIAVVDLEPASLPPESDGNERFLAEAQITFTLTQLAEIDQVAFSVDGELIPMNTDEGLALPFDPNITGGVDQSDYQSALLTPNEPGTMPSAGAPGRPTATPLPTPSPTTSASPTPGG